MNLDTLAKLGEFVGGMFVVISLVYLAYQMRQNTRSLRAENYGRLLDRMSTLQSRLSADPDLNRMFMIGAEHPELLSPAERIRFTWAVYEMLGNGEFMYHQWQDGMLPPLVWKRWQATHGWWMSHPGIRALWRLKATHFSSDFEAYCDDLIEHNRFDAEAHARWCDFVSGETPGG
jgi:hypothetical protein